MSFHLNVACTNPRVYARVTDEQRSMLIKLLKTNLSVKDAAIRVNIKYENAKAIYRVYRLEGRMNKKLKRERRSKFSSNSSNECEEKNVSFRTPNSYLRDCHEGS